MFFRLLALLAITTACAKPVALTSPKAPSTAQAVNEKVALAQLLKSQFDTSQETGDTGVSTSEVVTCPTSGTIQSTATMNEETFEYTSTVHANMCRDGDSYIDGTLVMSLFFEHSTIQFQNLTSSGPSFCEILTSTTNGSVTTGGGGMFTSHGNFTITYSEGPESLLNHTFNVVTQIGMLTGEINGTGQVTRDDGEQFSYTVTQGTIDDPAECANLLGYLQFTVNDGTIIRYQDHCEGGFPKLLIDGQEIDDDLNCT